MTFSPLPATAAPPPSPAPPAQSQARGAASEAAAASERARSTNQRVEVSSRLTPTRATFANPDGTYTDELTQSPTRVRAKDGSWAPVDVTLRPVSDGRLAPRNGPTRVSLRASATTSAASDVGRVELPGGGSVTMGFDGALAVPAVDGSSATYGLAANGQLRATARDDGFAADVVLRAAPTKATTYRFPIVTSGGLVPRLRHDAIEFVDKSGTIRATTAALRMWDAHTDSGGDPDHTQVVASRLTKTASGWVLELKPSLAFLTAPDRVYPVVIDPTVTVSNPADTWYYPGNTTSNGDDFALWVGKRDSDSFVARSYLRWNTGQFTGRVVTQATMSLWQYMANSCDPKKTRIYPTTTYAETSSTAVLVNKDDAWAVKENFNRGGGGCSGTTNGYSSMDVTKIVGGWTSGEIPNFALELRAGDNKSDSDEGDVANFKRFCAHELAPAGTGHCTDASYAPKLTVTYQYALGLQPADKTVDHKLNDRSNLSINTYNGNAIVHATDVHLGGRGLDLSVDRFYNSLSGTTDGQFGQGWTGTVGADVKLRRENDNDHFTYVAPGGTWFGRFVRKTSSGDTKKFFAPSFGGVDAKLEDKDDGEYKLTFHDTEEKYTFSDLGCSTCDKVLISDVDRNDNEIDYGYDSASRHLTSITDTHGRKLSIGYTTSGYVATIAESTAYTSSPRTWTYHYNAAKQLDYYVDPTSARTDYTYASGLLTTITDPGQADGKRPKTILTYANGQTTAVEYGRDAEATKKFTYAYSTDTNAAQSACNSDTSWTTYTTVTNASDPQGGATKYCYKDRSKQPDPLDPNGSSDDDKKMRVVDGAGHRRSTSFTPDMAARGGTNQSNEGVTAGSTVYTYDTNNNLTQVTKPKDTTGSNAGTTYFDYKTSSSVTGGTFLPSSTSTSASSCSSMSYDAKGNLTDVYSGLAATTGKTCTGSTSGKHHHVSHNDDGTPSEAWSPVTSDLSSPAPADKTTYTYYGVEPNKGELQKVVRPGGNASCTTDRTGCTTYVYDGLSRVSSTTDGNGRTTSYSYDNDDRITAVMQNGATTCNPSAGTCVKYAFDKEGNLTTRQDAVGTTGFAYDARNNPATQTQPDGTVIGTTYDGAGNLTQYQQTLPGQSGVTTKYVYDAANEMTSLVDATGTYAYSYNSDGRPTKMTYPTTPAVSVGYAYTKDGKLKSITPAGGSGLPTYSYSYNDGDDETDRVYKATVSGTTYDYDYNGDDQLKSLTPSSGTSYAYTYDDNANLRTAKAGSTTSYFGYNENNQLCWSGSKDGTAMGRSCPGTPTGDTGYTSDKHGNNLGSTTGPIHYNTQNQVDQISSPTGAGPVAMKYLDQGNNLRVIAGADTFTGGSQLGVTARRNSGGITYYTRDPYGQLVNAHGAGGTFHFLLDRQGTVTTLISTTGAKAGSYTYDPFGKTTAVSGTSTTAAQNNPWRYTGGYQDPTDGYYKLGARYYDAAGHFTQSDSIGGSLARPEKYNSYTYTAGDPANSTDLSGASPENPYACAASAALAAYAVYTFVSYVALGATGDALSAGTATPLVVLGGVGLGYATIASLALVPDACRS